MVTQTPSFLFEDLRPHFFSVCSDLVIAFASVGDVQRAALAAVSVRGSIVHRAPQTAEIATFEIGRRRGVRQEYATHFARGTDIYNLFNGFRFFWFVSADNAAILNHCFERSEIVGWDIQTCCNTCCE